MLIQFYAEKLLFKPCLALGVWPDWLVVLTVYLLLDRSVLLVLAGQGEHQSRWQILSRTLAAAHKGVNI